MNGNSGRLGSRAAVREETVREPMSEYSAQFAGLS